MMRLFSVIFHPLLMTSYSGVILYLLIPEAFSPIPYSSIPYFLGSLFFTTAFIPAVSILFLLFTKRISNLDITSMEERTFPFLSITLFYGVTSYMFYTKMNVSDTIMTLMISVTILIFIIFLVSLKYKISVHATASWAMAGAFSAITLNHLDTTQVYVLPALFLAAGFTSSSRIYLTKHAAHECWSGTVLGFGYSFSVMFFWA